MSVRNCDTPIHVASPHSVFSGNQSMRSDAVTVKSGACIKIETPSILEVFFTQSCLACAREQANKENDCFLQVGGFFVGSMYFSQDDTKVCIKFNRFDPGVHTNGYLSPKLTPEDAVLSPLFFISHSFDYTNHEFILSLINDFMNLKDVYEHLEFYNKVNNSLMLQLKLFTIVGGMTIKNSSENLAVIGSSTSHDIAAVSIPPLPIIHTALVKSITVVSDEASTSYSSGFITISEKGQLKLLLDTDPKIYKLSIVGIWVKGIERVNHPVVSLACLRFMNSTLFAQRATHKDFVLIIYPASGTKEIFYQCNFSSKTLNLFSSCAGIRNSCHSMPDGTLKTKVHKLSKPGTVVNAIQVLTEIVEQVCPNGKIENSCSQTQTRRSDHFPPNLMPSVPEPSLIMEETMWHDIPVKNILPQLKTLTNCSSAEPHMSTKSTQTESSGIQENGWNCPTCKYRDNEAKVTCSTQTDLVNMQGLRRSPAKLYPNTPCVADCEKSEFSSKSVCTSDHPDKSHVLSLSLGASASTCAKKQELQCDEDFFVETLLKQVNAVLCEPSTDEAGDKPKTNQAENLNPKDEESLLEKTDPIVSKDEIDLSMHANAIALKYLSDEHLHGLHGDLNNCSFKVPTSLLSEKCDESLMANNLSCATKQYLQKYGLTDSSETWSKRDEYVAENEMGPLWGEKSNIRYISNMEQLDVDVNHDKKINQSAGDTVKEILHPCILQTLNQAVKNMDSQQVGEPELPPAQSASMDGGHWLDRKRSNSTGRILSSQFLNLLAEKQTRRLSSSPKLFRHANTAN